MANRIAIKGAMLLSLGVLSVPTFGQQQTGLDGKTGTATTAVPFLRIGPDARSGAMGDVGIALSPDANSQYWNVAKLATSDKDFGAAVTYTPWLQELVPDVFLGYISLYKKIGAEKNQAISASLRYFNLGNINYTNMFAEPAGTGMPREFAFDVGYSRALSEYLSVGANLRYIHSNIAAGASDPSITYSPGSAFAGDVGLYYSKTNEVSEERSSTFSAGMVLSNIGSRISYTQNRQDFLPVNLGIGAAYTYKIDMYNKITFALDINKLTVPAPKQEIRGPGDTVWVMPQKTVVSGVLGSFDPNLSAPGYGSTVSVGGEYWYQDQFAIRAGYFYEDKNNGARQYFTCGLGVKYNVFGLNFSYLVPSGSGVARNPLSNTLRFSLLFDFDKATFEKLNKGKPKETKKDS